MRTGFFQDGLGAELVIGVAVTVQKQDRHGLHAKLVDPACQRRDLPIVERTFDLARRQHALAHLETQRALHQGFVFLEEEVVGIGPVDPADLVDVAKALGGDQRGLGTGPLEDRVDRDRRAMQEQTGIRKPGAGFGDAALDPVDQTVGR